METMGTKRSSTSETLALETRAVTFLQRRPGLPFCEECLARELDCRNPLLMRAVWRALLGSTARRLSQIEGTCSHCRRSLTVLYASVV